MRCGINLKHEFVEYIPDYLENGTIYISMVFATASHQCCCGCGNEVVTPISPTDWQLIFDGESISLSPSIGNWNFKCKSHYWIKNNSVEWARRWTSRVIRLGRKKDALSKKKYYNGKEKENGDGSFLKDKPAANDETKRKISFLKKVKKIFHL